jgi:hypothetical protein
MSSRANDPPPEQEGPSLEDDEMFARREGRDTRDSREAPRGVTDFVRRAIESTVGSVHNTGTISKEALHYVLQQGDRGRREVLRIFANEVGEFLRATDISRELTKVLTSVKIEVNASVRFKPTDDGKVEPSVETDVKVAQEEPKKDEEEPLPPQGS